MNLYVLIVSLIISGQISHAYAQAKTTAKASPVKQTANPAAEVLTNKSVVALYDVRLQADMESSSNVMLFNSVAMGNGIYKMPPT